MSEKRRESEVAAYVVKIPLFWPSDPTCMLWFAQVEVQFMLRGITAQLTKFHHVLADLSQEIVTEVKESLMNSPEEKPYVALKESNGDYSICLAMRILEIRSLLNSFAKCSS